MHELALDIGGANIKAAHADGGAWSVPFALWKEPVKLADKLREITQSAPRFDGLRITMTGELCDCFATKREGVNHILDAVESLGGGGGARVWSTAGRFVDGAAARAEPLKVAASNWHALATRVGMMFPRGSTLLVDTGSTTTDIIPLGDGKIVAKGMTDAGRLTSGELVYIGGERTPLMALGPRVEWCGRAYGVMAEYFAAMADVSVLSGDLAEDATRVDTADGRPLTRLFAAARVARMIGADLEMIGEGGAAELASSFGRMAEARIAEAVARVGVGAKRVVISGSGAALARRAVGMALPGTEMISLAEVIGPAASSAACAWALLGL